jgi:hypothetical protein
MKVVNLFAAPGTGKSTTGQILAGLLSIAQYRVEFVPEFAKFATFANNQAALGDPTYMMAKQSNRLHVLRNQPLDFVVMDGPLPTVLLYTPEDYYRHHEPLVMEIFNSYENANFLLESNPDIPYQTHGRLQNKQESAALARKLDKLIERHAVPVQRELVKPQLAMTLFTALTGHKAPSIELFD